MPDPISGASPRDVYWADPPSEAELRDRIDRQLSEQTYGYCREPSSTIQGAICDDPTAISNACRQAKPGSVDEFLCDDQKLEKVQDTIWSIAQEAIKLLLGAKMSK